MNITTRGMHELAVAKVVQEMKDFSNPKYKKRAKKFFKGKSGNFFCDQILNISAKGVLEKLERKEYDLDLLEKDDCEDSKTKEG